MPRHAQQFEAGDRIERLCIGVVPVQAQPRASGLAAGSASLQADALDLGISSFAMKPTEWPRQSLLDSCS
jgi:hypothetical protein